MSFTFTDLVTDRGQQQIVDFLQQIREENGTEWLDAIQRNYPTLSWMVDLVANHDANTAFELLCETQPMARLAPKQLKSLHARLREEIEKKR